MKVDWFRAISELEQAGITLRSQAITARVSLATIYYWKTGGQPKWYNGNLLLDLYMHQTGREPPLHTTQAST